GFLCLGTDDAHQSLPALNHTHLSSLMISLLRHACPHPCSQRASAGTRMHTLLHSHTHRHTHTHTHTHTHQHTHARLRHTHTHTHTDTHTHTHTHTHACTHTHTHCGKGEREREDGEKIASAKARTTIKYV